MFYVGLDIHTRHIAFCVLSEKGQLVRRGQVRGLHEVLRILKALPDRFEVCYGASRGYGYHHDLLQPLAARVHVAHPGPLRLAFRSKNKNDRNDAERLAKPLYLGEAPTAPVPSLEVRAWRQLSNCRGQVIAKGARAENTVRALLRSAGITPPEQPGLWTKKGLAWRRPLELPPPSQQLRRDLLLDEIETPLRQGRRIEQQVNHQAQHAPAVAQLRSIPGAGLACSGTPAWPRRRCGWGGRGAGGGGGRSPTAPRRGAWSGPPRRKMNAPWAWAPSPPTTASPAAVLAASPRCRRPS